MTQHRRYETGTFSDHTSGTGSSGFDHTDHECLILSSFALVTRTWW